SQLKSPAQISLHQSLQYTRRPEETTVPQQVSQISATPQQQAPPLPTRPDTGYAAPATQIGVPIEGTIEPAKVAQLNQAPAQQQPPQQSENVPQSPSLQQYLPPQALQQHRLPQAA